MAGSVIFEEQFEIPLDLNSLADFRRWALSDDFPERGRIDFIDGRIEVDMSPEDLFCHGTLKTEVVGVVHRRAKQIGGGHVFTDVARVSCPSANLSAEPDLVYLLDETIQIGSVHLIPRVGRTDKFIEIEGGPDLIVEIVSDSSVSKDTRRLPPAYFAAGVREFWLIDGRGDELSFMIHRRGPSAFDPVECDVDGFQPSVVLGRRYRLDRHAKAPGRWVYDLTEAPIVE
jgi:Uma2 family endonuclease